MLGAEAPAEVRGGRAGGSCQPEHTKKLADDAERVFSWAGGRLLSARKFVPVGSVDVGLCDILCGCPQGTRLRAS
jgi:hypothetical protein